MCSDITEEEQEDAIAPGKKVQKDERAPSLSKQSQFVISHICPFLVHGECLKYLGDFAGQNRNFFQFAMPRFIDYRRRHRNENTMHDTQLS